MFIKLQIKVVILALVLWPMPVLAMGVSLQWGANTETDLAGYEVFYDRDSGHPYEPSEEYRSDEGMPPVLVTFDKDENPDPDVVEFTLCNLSTGYSYYFVVKAFDTEGLRSGYSNEVHCPGCRLNYRRK